MNNESNTNINSITNDKSNEIDSTCAVVVDKLLGYYVIEYIPYLIAAGHCGPLLNENYQMCTGMNEYFSTNFPVAYGDWGNARGHFRVGSAPGENENWLYGDIQRDYTYNKVITQEDGTILGYDHFKIRVKIDDLSMNYPDNVNATDRNGFVYYKAGDVIQIEECGFVNISQYI